MLYGGTARAKGRALASFGEGRIAGDDVMHTLPTPTVLPTRLKGRDRRT